METVRAVKEKISYAFPVLRHRNFRFFWWGQCISSLGTWIQLTAQQWLVYSLTNSPFLLGLLGVFQFGPYLVFSLFAGVFVDRFAKKRILIATQTMMMIQTFILAALVWSGYIRYWHILALVALKGLVDTLDMPTRQSFFIELVGKDDLVGATALNSAVFNLARIVGPALSGLLMVYSGLVFCFFLYGVSFIPVLIGLWAINIRDGQVRKRQGTVLSEIGEGLKYISREKILSGALLVMLVVGTFAMNTNVLIPVLAREVLHKEAGGFSTLLSAMGAGAVAAAVFISVRAGKSSDKKTIFRSAFFLCLASVALGFIHHYWAAMILLGIFGFFDCCFLIAVNAVIQLNSLDQYRGRAMSLYSLAFLGTGPVGNLFAGTVAEKYGANAAFFTCGVITMVLIGAVLLWLSQAKRRKKLVL